MNKKEHLSFSELRFTEQVSVVMQLFDTPSVYLALPREYGEYAGTLQFYEREKIFPATYSNRHQYLDLVVSDLEKEKTHSLRDMALEVYQVAHKLRVKEAMEIVMQYVEDSR